jgi:hypothetical protein
MGGSALRGMAFEKPVIVTGEQNFAALFTPETKDFFYEKGLYGEGDDRFGSDRLVRDMARLLDSQDLRNDLGRFARGFVEQHYSIDAVGRELNELLVSASTAPDSFGDVIYDTCRTATLVAAKRFRSQIRWPKMSRSAAAG